MEREELFNMESRWRIENYADNTKFRRDGLKTVKEGFYESNYTAQGNGKISLNLEYKYLVAHNFELFSYFYPKVLFISRYFHTS